MSSLAEDLDDLRGLSIDTTSVCNLRCTICSLEESYPVKMLMPLELFERLRPEFRLLKHLALSSSAEPLLHPRLERMLEIAKEESGGRTVVSFTTNGVLLGESRLRGLLARGLDALEISLDGASAATFEGIRRRARFERVAANVARIARVKRELGLERPSLSMRWTLSSDNLHELPALLELARRWEIPHLVVNGLEPYSEQQSAKILYGDLADPGMVALFERLETEALAAGQRLDLPRLTPEAIEDCDLVAHSCLLTVEGFVVPCSPLVYERRFWLRGQTHGHPRLSFGSIAERDLGEIWGSAEYTAWRASLRHGLPYDYCKCCLKRMGVICPLKHWQWLSGKPVDGPGAARPAAQ